MSRAAKLLRRLVSPVWVAAKRRQRARRAERERRRKAHRDLGFHIDAVALAVRTKHPRIWVDVSPDFGPSGGYVVRMRVRRHPTEWLWTPPMPAMPFDPNATIPNPERRFDAGNTFGADIVLSAYGWPYIEEHVALEVMSRAEELIRMADRDDPRPQRVRDAMRSREEARS